MRGKGQEESWGTDKFYPLLFQFSLQLPLKRILNGQREAVPKIASSPKWLHLGTADAGVGCINRVSAPAQRQSDSWEAGGFFEETPACISQHPLPLFAPLEIITPKWPIISVSMIFSHLLKAFPLAHLYFFLLFLSNCLIPSPLYFAVN